MDAASNLFELQRKVFKMFKSIFLGAHKLKAIDDLLDLSEARRQELKSCGKVILSQSVLERCTGYVNLPFPLIFRIESMEQQDIICGVSTFEAAHKEIHIPPWMMTRLGVEEEQSVKIFALTQTIPKGTDVLLQPMTSDFLEVSNPKAVLERGLLSFTCISDGETFPIAYNDRMYEMRVTETRPARTILLTDCDLSVEFMQPADYVEDKSHDSSHEESVKFSQGCRLDGRPISPCESTKKVKKAKRKESPDHSFKRGSLKFKRPKSPKTPQPSFEERRRASMTRHEELEKKKANKEMEEIRQRRERVRRQTEQSVTRTTPVMTRSRARLLAVSPTLAEIEEMDDSTAASQAMLLPPPEPREEDPAMDTEESW